MFVGKRIWIIRNTDANLSNQFPANYKSC